MQIPRINYNDLPDNEFETIEAGEYSAIITKCEYVATKDGNNFLLNFTFKITEGKYSGRIVSYRIFQTYNDMKDGADRVNQQKQKSLQNAIGLKHDIEDTDEFLNGECLIKVSINDKGNNDIKNFRPLPQNNITPGSVRNTTPIAPPRNSNARTFAQTNPSRPVPRRRTEE